MPTIGTCSNCNGPVQVPDLWGGTVPPVPTCAHCGATAKDPYGPTIPMEKRSCERCDAQGRCSSGTKYAWDGKGRVESPCACACHLSPVGVDDLAASLLDARERMISALGPKFGEAFDGDFDVMQDAAKALAQQPAAVGDEGTRDAWRTLWLVLRQTGPVAVPPYDIVSADWSKCQIEQTVQQWTGTVQLRATLLAAQHREESK